MTVSYNAITGYKYLNVTVLVVIQRLVAQCDVVQYNPKTRAGSVILFYVEYDDFEHRADS